MLPRSLIAVLWLVGVVIGIATLGSRPAAAADLRYFYCYAPSPGDGTTYVSDVHPVGPVAERRAYGEQFVAFLRSEGKISGGATGYCVMRATMDEIERGRTDLAHMDCMECKGAEKVANIDWPRGDARPDSGVDKPMTIADAFKVQNDAERSRVTENLSPPRIFAGHPWAYCYQYSVVDSVLYETDIFSTKKGKTALELAFADIVTRETRIGAAMSTHCYVTSDATYLDNLRRNVRQVHGSPVRLDTPK